MAYRSKQADKKSRKDGKRRRSPGIFLLRLREHQIAADTARNIFAAWAGIGVLSGVLSVAFLMSDGSKHEPRKHVKPETTEQRTKPAPLPAPASPAPAPLPFGEQKTIETAI
jgi:hypothetical protein